MIDVAIFGAGRIGKIHAGNLVRQPGVQMIRIKLPYGKATSEQLKRIADVSDKDFFIEPGTRLIDGEFYVPVSRFMPTVPVEQPDYEVE
jgi:hypothetical protein